MFKKALPIWLRGLENEKNIQAKFVARFKGGKNTVLKITGATFYKISLNDKIVHYGPSPAARGYARVDMVMLDTVPNGEYTLTVEAAGYNCYSYASVKQTSYVIAEICDSEQVIAWTGHDFKGYRVNSREQKVLRYSFQRHFTEIWNTSVKDTEHPTAVLELNIKFLKRRAPLPDIGFETIRKAYCKDSFTVKPNDLAVPDFQGAVYGKDRCDVDLFPFDEIGEKPIKLFSELEYYAENKPCDLPCSLNTNEYAVFECKANTCGLLSLKYSASPSTKLLIVFDEKLRDGRFHCASWESFNVIELNTSGKGSFTSFEVYGFKYFAVFVLDGSLEINEAGVITVLAPLNNIPTLNCDDEEILRIYDAACQSARCNTLGIFMDCPTRERAGWLCDSYFTSQAIYTLDGNTDLEDDFIENFLYADEQWLPPGMLPMCYPADHPNGNFIPQWAMWYILELDQYKDRNRSVSVGNYRFLSYRLLEYFESHENELGLLEDLDGWNFVEWSKANDWTAGINFPTNMLYCKILSIIGTWYNDDKLLKKSDKLKQRIIEMSYDGCFFRDQALRNSENTPQVLEHISEVCQYYAFMFEVADGDRFDALRHVLITEFSTDRAFHEDIEGVDALMGMYMRMELLLKWGHHEQLIGEVKSFFGHMASITGTLWEKKHMTNSLNHGFTSYLTVVLLRIFGGI
ncbi:MAG: hypothetical protein IKM46_08365 [Clostridia bacterium]|nr:hypothetical protein [Clostridia bacterium]